ncbi:hypothetical protein [Enterobacter cloacae]|uniref:hypothetical protein n=1 Tax=Enterobacter cloacae TaxID=550 RepID=UPI002B1FD46B|nr:hypothetical protein [Enterobacter cloacae]MEA5216210.1 hypothetical protein [Enterobacter cloacae]
MTDLPKCLNCGHAPYLKVRSRGMNWGSAEVRCSNGCPDRRAGFSFPSGGEAAARRELEEKWIALVGVEENKNG